MIPLLQLNRKLTYLFIALLLVCFGEVNSATAQQTNHPNRRTFRFNFRAPRQCAGGDVTMGGELVITFKNFILSPINQRMVPEFVNKTAFSGTAQSGNRALRVESIDLKDVHSNIIFNDGEFKIEMIVTGPPLPGGSPLRLKVLFAPNGYAFQSGLVTDFNPDRTPKVDCINP